MHAPVRWSLGTAVALAALAAVGALWFAFAPTAVGGTADYAVVAGTSMEPLLARGDLAVLRARTHYRVGDVVAYHNTQLGRVVLHRIVAIRGGRYVFKGDHNDFVDTPHATRAELIGRLWFRVPAAGRAVTWLHDPVNAAIAGGAIALLLLVPGKGTPARRRRRRSAAPARVPVRATVVGIAVLAAALLAVAALVAWTRPLSRAVSVPGAYTSSGIFSYRAQAVTGAVYPSGTVAAGEPVFTRLAHRLRLSLDYRFRSPFPHAASGTARVATVLTSSLGWRRVVAATPPRRFDGDAARLTTTLDLGALERATATYLRSTGVPSDTFSVRVEPRVLVRARVDGQPVDQTFAPTVSFALDPYSLRLEQPSPPETPGQPAPDPLRPTLVGSLTRHEANALAVAGVRASLASVRRIALAGFCLTTLLAFACAAMLGERRRLLRRYRDSIVSIRVRPDGDIVEVASFDVLSRLAAGEQRVILDDGDAFFVKAGDTLYRYRPTGADEPTLEMTPRLV